MFEFSLKKDEWLYAIYSPKTTVNDSIYEFLLDEFTGVTYFYVNVGSK